MTSWATNVDIPLVLLLLNEAGEGVPNKTPAVAIRRHHSPTGLLDGFYWNGTTFQSAPFYHDMTAVADVVGVYHYLFQQTLINVPSTYLVQYQHLVEPIGFFLEMHTVSSSIPTILSQLGDMNSKLTRALGLLHENSIVDNQTYDGTGQITGARIRVFDSAGNVPNTPGGNETTGLLHRYAMTAAYAGIGLLSSFKIKKEL